MKDPAKVSVETVTEITRDFDKTPLELKSTLLSKDSTSDILLKPNDEFANPSFDGQVRINGSVLLSSQIPYTQNILSRII